MERVQAHAVDYAPKVRGTQAQHLERAVRDVGYLQEEMEAGNQPYEPDYEPIHPGGGRNRSLRQRLEKLGAPIVAALVLLVTKGKFILLALSKVKIFTTSATMLVSIAAYAWIWGWAFAVGFVLLLLVHEMGHVIQLRREGIEASAPMFIPFLGAVVAAKSMGDDAAAEARVGLAGPILGTVATLVPLLIWQVTGEEFWQALAYVGFFINLFNLLPVLPLDGGRAMAALSPWVWIVGYAGLVALTFVFPNPIMILILILGGFESWRRFKDRNTPEARAFHDIPARTRFWVAVTYLGLAAALAFGVSETFLEKDFSDA
jgi:Zn-dependent protease